MSRSWWRQPRYWLIIGACILTSVIFALAYLRTDSGLRHIVLPLLSRQTGLQISADRVRAVGFRDFYAENLRIQAPLDQHGATLELWAPKSKLVWDRHNPLQIECNNAVIQMPEWPVLDETQSRPLRLDILRRLPNFKADLINLIVELPHSGPSDHRLPRVHIPEMSFANHRGVLTITSNRSIDLRGALLWDIIGPQMLSVDMAIADRPGEPMVKGTLKIHGKYPNAASYELEELSLASEFEIGSSGSGFCRIDVRHKESQMITIETSLGGLQGEWKLDFNVLGHAQTLNMKGGTTHLHIREWQSNFSISWLASQATLASEGRFAIPGINVALDSSGTNVLPSITMRGSWGATRHSGKLSWNGEALISRADDIILKVSAAHGRGEFEDRPVNLLIPDLELAAVRPYLEPFGIRLPDGRVAAKFSIDPGQLREHQVTLDLTVSDLSGIRGLPPGFRLQTTVNVSAVLDSEKILTVEDVRVGIRLQDAQRNLLSKGSLDLESPVSLTLNPQTWARPAAAAGVILRMDVSPTILDHFRVNPPPRRQDPQVMAFNGHLRLDLDGDELMGNLNLHGNHDDIRFVRLTSNLSWLLGSGLRFIELTMFEVNGVQRLFDELLPDLPFRFERLAISGLLRGIENRRQAPNYQFSARLRALGAHGWPGAPDWLQASATTLVTGAVLPAERELSIADLRGNAKFFESRRMEPAGELSLSLTEALKWRWPEGIAGLSSGTASVSLQCTQRLIRRLRDDPEYATAGTEPVRLDLLLATAREDGEILRTSLQAGLGLGDNALASLAMGCQIHGNGDIIYLNIEDFTSSVPAMVHSLVSPKLPIWEKVSVSGNIDYNRHTPEENQFSLSLATEELANVPSLPEWIHGTGTLTVNGSWDPAHALQLNLLEWEFRAFDPIASHLELMTQGQLPEPMTIAWDESLALAEFPNALLSPNSLKGKVSATVRASGAFLARLREHQVESDKFLEMAMTADLQRAAGINSLGWTLNASYDKRPLVDIAGRVDAKKDYEIASLELDHLRLHHDPELFSILLPNQPLPQWTLFECKASLVPGPERLRASGDFTVTDVTGGYWLPDWLATSGTLSVEGSFDPVTRVLEAEKLRMVTNTIKGEDPEGAHLVWQLTKPLSVRFQPIPELRDTVSSSMAVAGQIPYAYFHRYFHPADFTSQSGMFDLSTTLQLSRQGRELRAGLEFDGKLSDTPVSSGVGSITMLPDWSLQKGDFRFRIGYHEKLRSLFSPRFMPAWEVAELKLDLKPGDGLQVYAFAGTIQSGRVDRFPAAPAWLQAKAGATFSGAVSLTKGSLELQTFHLTADAGAGAGPLENQAVLRVDLKDSLVCSLERGFRPIPGSNAALHIDFKTDQAFLARLRSLELPESDPAAGYQLAADLVLQPSPDQVQMNLGVRLVADAQELIRLHGAAAFTSDWRLLEATLTEFELQYQQALASLIPEYKGMAFGRAEGRADIVSRAEGGHGITSEFTVFDGRLPGIFPEPWRVEWRARAEAGVNADRTLELNQLEVRGLGRLTDAEDPRGTIHAQLKSPARWRFGPWDKNQPEFNSRIQFAATLGDANDLLQQPLTSEPASLKLGGDLSVQSNQGVVTVGLNAAAGAGDRQILVAVGQTVFDPLLKVSEANLKVSECRAQPHILKFLGLDFEPSWDLADASAELRGIADGFQVRWSVNINGLHNMPRQPGWLQLNLKTLAVTDLLLDGNRALTGLDWSLQGIDAQSRAPLFQASFKQVPETTAALPGAAQKLSWLDLATHSEAVIYPALWPRLPLPRGDDQELPKISLAGSVATSSQRRLTASLTAKHGGQILATLNPSLQFNSSGSVEAMVLESLIEHAPPALLARFVEPGRLPAAEKLQLQLQARAASQSESEEGARWDLDLQLNARALHGGWLDIGESDLALRGTGQVQAVDARNWAFSGSTVLQRNDQSAVLGALAIQRAGESWAVDGNPWRLQLGPTLAMIPRMLPVGRQCMAGELSGQWSWRGTTSAWEAGWDLNLGDAVFADRDGKALAPAQNWSSKGRYRSAEQLPRELDLTLVGPGAANRLAASLSWQEMGNLRWLPSRINLTGGHLDVSPWYQIFGTSREPHSIRPIRLTDGRLRELLPIEQPAPPVRISRPRWLPETEELNNANLDWQIELPSFTCASLQLRDLVGRVWMNGRKIEISSLQASAGNGEFALKGSLNTVPGDIDLRLTAKVSDFPLGILRDYFPPSESGVSGSLSGNFTVTMAGADPRSAWYAGRGKGRLSLNGLRLPSVFPQLQNPATLLRVPDLAAFAFDALTIDMEVDKRHLIIRELAVNHPSIQLKGNGAIRLDGWIDWQNSVLQFNPEHWRQLDPRQVRAALGSNQVLTDKDGLQVMVLPFQWRGFWPAMSLHTADQQAFQRFAASSFGSLLLGALEPEKQ